MTSRPQGNAPPATPRRCRTAELAEHRDPLLAAGLRFYVRGDVLTEDGELSLRRDLPRS
jgi:hypothetical protein